MAKLITRKEADSRRVRYLIFAGMFDFLSTVAGLILIVACIVLISSLVNWIVADAEVSFASLYKIFTTAIMTPD